MRVVNSRSSLIGIIMTSNCTLVKLSCQIAVVDFFHWYSLVLCNSRVGLVESKVRILVGMLEKNQYVKLAHVNPTSYGPLDSNDAEERRNIRRWFIGLEFCKVDQTINVDLTPEIQYFRNTVEKQAYQTALFKDGMKIEAKHVKKKQLHQYLPNTVLRVKKKSSTQTSLKKQISNASLKSLEEGSQDNEGGDEADQKQAQSSQETSNGLSDEEAKSSIDSKISSDDSLQVGVKRRGIKRPSSPLDEESSPLKKIRDQTNNGNRDGSSQGSSFDAENDRFLEDNKKDSSLDQNVSKNPIKLTLKE